MVFQNYALFPHMNVFENVAFGLRVTTCSASDIEQRVRSVLASVELEGRHQEMVATLSGGEQQRVAVARALVIEPIPASVRRASKQSRCLTATAHTRGNSGDPTSKTRITTVYVTHDQSEAMSLSDRMAILKDGRIDQIGTPREVYESPASPFVARFLGWPNVLIGELLLVKAFRLGSTTDSPPRRGESPPTGENHVVAIPARCRLTQGDLRVCHFVARFAIWSTSA